MDRLVNLMLSNFLEATGLVAFVAGVYVLLGLGAAFLAASPALLVLGMAADGVKPLQVARGQLTRRWAAFRFRRQAARVHRAA
jgi:hypothetical protein